MSYENLAGIVESKVRRATGTRCSVYRAEEAGFDTFGGDYAIVCEEHGSIVNVETRKRAEHHAVRPDGFCEDCVEIVREREAASEPEAREEEEIRRIEFSTTEGRSDRTEATYGKHGEGAAPCLLCGRQTDGSRQVYVDLGFGAVVHPKDHERSMSEDPAGWMGAFSIGPDCQKNAGIPDSFLIGSTEDL